MTTYLAQGVGQENHFQTVIEAGLPPLIAAALATLGFWLKERLLGRDQRMQRRRAIEDSLSHLSYLKLWLETDALTGEGGQYARREVRQELHLVQARLRRTFQDEPRADGPSAVRRTLLKVLLVPLHGAWARRVRVLYWVSLWLFASIFSSIVASLQWDSVSGIISISMLIFLLPSLGLYFLASRLETTAVSQAEPSRTEPALNEPPHPGEARASRWTERADGHAAGGDAVPDQSGRLIAEASARRREQRDERAAGRDAAADPQDTTADLGLTSGRLARPGA